MDRMRWVLAFVMTLGLAACGGGGGSPTASVTTDPPTVGDDNDTIDPTTEVQPLSVTVAEEGLAVRSSQSLSGSNVSIAIDNGFGITIATNDGTTIRFDERNRTYFRRIFGGYATDDDTDLTVIALPNQDQAGLNYATYGYWAQSDDPGLIDGDSSPSQGGAFFGGNNTPIDNMPTTGSAIYEGFAVGNDSISDGGSFGAGEGLVVGTSTFTADFAANTIAGELILGNAVGEDYGIVNMPATSITANTFEQGSITSSLGHTGSMRGQFFGPEADELAGLAQLSGPSQLSIAFGARK